MNLPKMKTVVAADNAVREMLGLDSIIVCTPLSPQPRCKLVNHFGWHCHNSWTYPDEKACDFWNDEAFRLPPDLTDEERKMKWHPMCRTNEIIRILESFVEYNGRPYYEADLPKGSKDLPPKIKWQKPSTMPIDLSRVFLKATGLQIKRLHDMTGADVFVTTSYRHSPLRELTVCQSQWDRRMTDMHRSKTKWAENPWLFVTDLSRISNESEINRLREAYI